jgi:SnoaL-like domain
MIDPLTAYRAYSAAWNEADPGRRNRLLVQSWAVDGVLVDPDTPDGVVGRDAVAEYMAATHDGVPDLTIVERSEPEVLGTRLRVSWVARQRHEDVYTGTDFIEFADDGRIARVTMFYDSTPEGAQTA